MKDPFHMYPNKPNRTTSDSKWCAWIFCCQRTTLHCFRFSCFEKRNRGVNSWFFQEPIKISPPLYYRVATRVNRKSENNFCRNIAQISRVISLCFYISCHICRPARTITQGTNRASRIPHTRDSPQSPTSHISQPVTSHEISRTPLPITYTPTPIHLILPP